MTAGGMPEPPVLVGRDDFVTLAGRRLAEIAAWCATIRTDDGDDHPSGHLTRL